LDEIPDLREATSEDRLTRTRFLGAGAAAVGAMSGLGALATPSQALARINEIARIGAPAAGILDWATEEPASHFDPAGAADIGSLVGIEHIFEALMQLNARGIPEPQLITGLPKKIGPRQLAVVLRRGLVFHDGRPLTAADVVFTYERHKNPKTASIHGPALATLRSVHADGDRRVVFTLKQYTDYFPTTLAVIKIFSAAGVRAQGAAKYFLKPAGSGVFQVAELRPQVSFRLVRAVRYKGIEPRPPLDQVTSTGAAVGTSRVARLRSGAFDVIDHVPIPDIASLEHASGIEVGETLGSAQVNMEFEHSRAPFNDVRVRLAFMRALNPAAISQVVFRGRASAAYSMLARSNPYNIEPRTKYAHNPGLARKLLAAAGHADGLDFEMLVKSDTVFVPQVAQVMQQQLQQVGLRPKLRLVTGGGGYTMALAGKYQCFLSYYNIGLFSDPVDYYYRFAQYGANGEAYYRWKDAFAKRYVELVDRAYVSTSFQQRRRRYGQAQELLNQQVPGAVPIMYVPVVSGWRDEVRGFRTPGNDLSDFRRVRITS
jgi:peptide/nickel transport system substrate-binding protein